MSSVARDVRSGTHVLLKLFSELKEVHSQTYTVSDNSCDVTSGRDRLMGVGGAWWIVDCQIVAT